MNKVLSVMCALMASLAFATPVISDLKVTSLPPWGLAIDYNVSGALERDIACPLSVTMTVDGTTYTAKNLTGATNWVNGAHHLYWDMAKEGFSFDVKDATVGVEYKYIAPYCVIDLCGGSEADSYPVTYLDAPPSGGFNTTEYKTTKLVLKRVDAGSFKMQNSTDVTLTKSFYMGLFEVTQKQWELVMGSNPCSSTSYGEGNAYPVYYVSYNMIRGSSEGAKWPASNSVDRDSFLGKLRERTKLEFDLPTEAQWEYTCRAGTTTTYSYGDSANGDYMWYYDNSSDGTKEVGTKKANPWGFYDMHGNVWEWCLDRYNSSLSGGEDPKGSSSGSSRVLRGGSWYDDASNCTSSSRCSSVPSYYYNDSGFRLSRTLP